VSSGSEQGGEWWARLWERRCELERGGTHEDGAAQAGEEHGGGADGDHLLGAPELLGDGHREGDGDRARRDGEREVRRERECAPCDDGGRHGHDRRDGRAPDDLGRVARLRKVGRDARERAELSRGLCGRGAAAKRCARGGVRRRAGVSDQSKEEWGAGSREQGAGSREQGAGRRA